MRPINFEVKEKQGETVDKLIKKFLKKVSKSKVIQIHLDSLSYKTRSQKKREKKAKSRYIKQKIQEEFLDSLKNES